MELIGVDFGRTGTSRLSSPWTVWAVGPAITVQGSRPTPAHRALARHIPEAAGELARHLDGYKTSVDWPAAAY